MNMYASGAYLRDRHRAPFSVATSIPHLSTCHTKGPGCLLQGHHTFLGGQSRQIVPSHSSLYRPSGIYLQPVHPGAAKTLQPDAKPQMPQQGHRMQFSVLWTRCGSARVPEGEQIHSKHKASRTGRIAKMDRKPSWKTLMNPKNGQVVLVNTIEVYVRSLGGHPSLNQLLEVYISTRTT